MVQLYQVGGITVRELWVIDGLTDGFADSIGALLMRVLTYKSLLSKAASPAGCLQLICASGGPLC